MKFSEEQQAAVNVRENCVVSAGAGSGKTAVLSERFVSLLLDPVLPAEVDEILTLTFTNKATGEMRDRIYRRILEKIKESGFSEKDRSRLIAAHDEVLFELENETSPSQNEKAPSSPSAVP